MTDPIADMLTRIRNASRVRKAEVVIPHSKIKESILEVLVAEGYIDGFAVDEKHVPAKQLVVRLKYYGKKPAVEHLRRVSKSGVRKYVDQNTIPRVLNGLGIAILSTSKGIMTGAQARKEHVGGEVLCEIY